MVVARRRWRPVYHAVRRHLKKAADALATLGVYRALERLSEGNDNDEIEVWCKHIAFEQRGWKIPTAIPSKPDIRLLRYDAPYQNAPPDAQRLAEQTESPR